MPNSDLDLLSINTLRTLAIDVVQKADSGHPGLPLGAAPMAYVLWQRHLKHNPQDPQWPDRDRFVLSAGHGSMLLYGLLHLTGYDITMNDVLAFRQYESKTPGHPEFGYAPGVEATTGPLGQGHVNAVGMAIAERALAHRFNKPGHDLVDHFTYALISDGDVMEGVTAEAASLAGHLKLGKLICLYDANDVTLDGPANLCFSEDVGKRYESYGWQVLHVKDGNTDLDAIDRAIAAAKADTARPSIIIIKTTIGYGSPNKAGKSSSHGSPLGDAEIAATKKQLGWDPEKKFFVPDEAGKNLRQAVEKGQAAQAEWQKRFDAYAKEFPDLADEWRRRQKNELPRGFDWDAVLPTFKAEPAETRTTAGKVLGALAAKLPELIGGDADLGGSTKTQLKDAGFFEGQKGSGRNIAFGIREHAMASICNGIAYHGGLRAFDATFFCFSDYMRPAVRLAALSHLPVVHVWTHDSVGLGEDGPTHQAVEHLASLRAMPGLYTIRPCDGAESAEAWRMALERNHAPTGLVLSRQKVPGLDRTKYAAAKGLHQGGYVLSDAAGFKAIILSSGSEVQFALAAQDALAKQGVPTRVVSLPCWEAFREQPQAYRDQVLPPNVTARVSIEAGTTFGWREWVGDRGVAIGVDRYGASAPWEVIYQKLGLTPEAVVAAVKKLVG
ncbi:MAG: transketolase [Myxococcaceae bacterium]|nr:transketolase [Myxococcaceae bacterium]